MLSWFIDWPSPYTIIVLIGKINEVNFSRIQDFGQRNSVLIKITVFNDEKKNDTNKFMKNWKYQAFQPNMSAFHPGLEPKSRTPGIRIYNCSKALTTLILRHVSLEISSKSYWNFQRNLLNNLKINWSWFIRTIIIIKKVEYKSQDTPSRCGKIYKRHNEKEKQAQMDWPS